MTSLSSLKNIKDRRKDDYFFFCVDGLGGYGKTVMLSALTYISHKDYNKVYANFTLKGISNFEKLPKRLSKPIILNLEPNSLIVLTEAYLYFDCRFSLKSKNIDVTHALFQARKMGFDIIYDIPSFRYSELRLKEWTKLIIHARGRVKKGSSVFRYDFGRYFAPIDDVICFRKNIPLDMSEYFKYYDSYEVIDKQTVLKTFEQKSL